VTRKEGRRKRGEGVEGPEFIHSLSVHGEGERKEGKEDLASLTTRRTQLCQNYLRSPASLEPGGGRRGGKERRKLQWLLAESSVLNNRKIYRVGTNSGE